jgi:TatD DNase family protein
MCHSVAGPIQMRLVDTHCHLNLPRSYPDLGDVLARAREAGVERMIVVGFDDETAPEALRLAAEHDCISAVVGIHPNSSTGFGPDQEALVREWLSARGVVGVGETGLDLYRDHAPLGDQMRSFRWHLDAASERGLPVVIHCREAYDEVLAELGARRASCCGVLHCFGGTPEHARQALDLGFHIGVGGPVTFKKSERLREIVRSSPADQLLLETDCPFLAPEPRRGKRNEPAFVRIVAEAVAAVRDEPIESVAGMTSANAERLFRLGEQRRDN